MHRRPPASIQKSFSRVGFVMTACNLKCLARHDALLKCLDFWWSYCCQKNVVSISNEFGKSVPKLWQFHLKETVMKGWVGMAWNALLGWSTYELKVEQDCSHLVYNCATMPHQVLQCCARLILRPTRDLSTQLAGILYYGRIGTCFRCKIGVESSTASL